MPTLTKNLIEQMYDPNLSDADNAKRIECSRSTVTYWRISKGYKSKFVSIPIDSKKLKELHSKGFSDTETARAMCITYHGVRKCRERLGLERNECALGRPSMRQSVVKAKSWMCGTDDPDSLFRDDKFIKQFITGEFEEEFH